MDELAISDMRVSVDSRFMMRESDAMYVTDSYPGSPYSPPVIRHFKIQARLLSYDDSEQLFVADMPLYNKQVILP